jgi:hypothetical protein
MKPEYDKQDGLLVRNMPSRRRLLEVLGAAAAGAGTGVVALVAT